MWVGCCEQVGDRSDGKDIGVEVDQGGEQGVEAEKVEFGEREIEIGTACKSQLNSERSEEMGDGVRRSRRNRCQEEIVMWGR